jgi:hypothetical protein
MKLTALHHVRPMRGHTKPQLIFCDDLAPYVVKFNSVNCSPRHLISEYVVTEIAREIGFSTPQCGFVDVSQFLIDNTPDLGADSPHGVDYSAGLHFGSRVTGAYATDFLPQDWIDKLTNRSEFVGMLALDNWCANISRRKAVFCREGSDSRYTAKFISHEMCFGGAQLNFTHSTLAKLFYNCSVYRDVDSWDSFEPYLSRLTSMTPETVLRIVGQLPSEWCHPLGQDIERLTDALLCRRTRVHGLIAESIAMAPASFPRWRRNVSFCFGSNSSVVDVFRSRTVPTPERC